MSLNKSEYKRIRKNLMQQYRSMIKRGYYTEKNIIPPIPKRITEGSIRKLKKIQQSLYDKMKYVSPETGEIIPGKKGKELARKRGNEKRKITLQIKRERRTKNIANTSFFSRHIIDNFKERINPISKNGKHNNTSDILNNWIDSLIELYGEEAVSQMLEDGAKDGNIVNYEIMYDETSAFKYINEMINYLPPVGQFTKDFLEERIGEAQESGVFDFMYGLEYEE